MALSGFVGCPSVSLHLSDRRAKWLGGRALSFPTLRTSRDLLTHNGNFSVRFVRDTNLTPRGSIRCAMDASYGDSMNDSSGDCSSSLSYKGLSLSVKASAAATSVNSTVVEKRDKRIDDPIIVIDNYDSFTYNLCQYMGELGCLFEVYRNDELSVDELKRKNPRGVLISPGPGTPQDSGISLQTVLELGPTVPLFGVCMGLQCIGEAFGGKIVRSPNGVMHGKSSPVFYDEKGHDGLFAGLSNPFTAGRYHSLVIEKDSFPSEELEVTAWTEDGLIMAARHKKYKHLQGVQFHPESIITEEGKTIVRNFIKMVEKHNAN